VDLDQALDVDAVVIQALHREYESLDWGSFRGLRVVLDGRGSLDAEDLRSSGVTVISVAQPPRS